MIMVDKEDFLKSMDNPRIAARVLIQVHPSTDGEEVRFVQYWDVDRLDLAGHQVLLCNPVTREVLRESFWLSKDWV